ncbi:UDP-glucose 4-epimerase [Bacillus oleivorans]|uniref:UDP-glucose 4-epimerase n=1 Tax=Bacillus oleivorans TaxID=1448271 RepID=A0A285CLR1_9BACI|nr:UDP-glucose 4-epimerase GalE [Bacillus oleivorans]SNX68509.1 UDP-glucose 4-epimerase [Bacillus oleivorans]
MSILVVGGAGYIGSHAVYKLIEKNERVVVIDNLSTGHKNAIHPKAVFYQGDIRDKVFLEKVFQQEKIVGVLHFAALSLVGESMSAPLPYFYNNVYGTQILLDVMKEFYVRNLVFSSSAAIYGEPSLIPITEDALPLPANPYGESKLAVEKLLKWCDHAYGIRFVALRYFNVAGAHASGEIGEAHDPETHLIPLVLEVALGKRKYISIFGDDYSTKDGTCIRDYIHVDDLVDAHLLALKYLMQGGKSDSFNIGSDQGFSVLDIIKAAQRITKHPIPSKITERRQGDPGCLIASSEKAKSILGWKPVRTSVETMIKDAWRWHHRHPLGYKQHA